MKVKFYCDVYLKGKEDGLLAFGKYLPVLQNSLIPVMETFQILGNEYLPNKTLDQESLQANYIPLVSSPKWRLTLPFAFQFEGLDHARNMLSLLECLFRCHSHYTGFEIDFRSVMVEDDEVY